MMTQVGKREMSVNTEQSMSVWRRIFLAPTSIWVSTSAGRPDLGRHCCLQPQRPCLLVPARVCVGAQMDRLMGACVRVLPALRPCCMVNTDVRPGCFLHMHEISCKEHFRTAGSGTC